MNRGCQQDCCQTPTIDSQVELTMDWRDQIEAAFQVKKRVLPGISINLVHSLDANGLPFKGERLIANTELQEKSGADAAMTR